MGILGIANICNVRGEKMVKETIDAIREAEFSASELEKEAVKKREEILSNAQVQAKTIVASVTKDAMTKAELDMEQARLQGLKLMEIALQNAEKEILVLKEETTYKKNSIIEIILSDLIQS